jgi:predicted nuclease with TOPRIM domain
MADSTKFETSLQRFEQALKLVEASLARKAQENARLKTLEIEKATLESDKQRMDRELATVRVKAQELVDTSKQAVGKIDSAMSRIRSVLHSNSGQ